MTSRNKKRRYRESPVISLRIVQNNLEVDIGLVHARIGLLPDLHAELVLADEVLLDHAAMLVGILDDDELAGVVGISELSRSVQNADNWRNRERSGPTPLQSIAISG